MVAGGITGGNYLQEIQEMAEHGIEIEKGIQLRPGSILSQDKEHLKKKWN